MSKEITIWCLVCAEGTVRATYSTYEAALKYLHRRPDRRIVKLTGEVPPEPKKPKLMAPALAYFCGQHQVSSTLFSSEMQARNELREMFRAWPALPNKDGYYEVME